MDEHSTEVSTVRRDDAVDDPKEDLPLSARGMTATNAAGGTFGLGIDQFELPKASVMKLARSEIPDTMQLRKDTMTALVKSASVFVSYLTAASHDVAKARHQKTIHAAHVIDAMRELDFPPAMRRELREQLEGAWREVLADAAYRELQKRHAAERAEAAAANRAQAKAARAAAAAAGDDSAMADVSAMGDESVSAAEAPSEGAMAAGEAPRDAVPTA